MKPIKYALVALLLIPGVAAAQGYGGGGYYNQPNPIPGGFHDRTGRLTWGGSIGLGGMHDNGSGLTTSDNNAPSVEIDGHIGAMLSPRFALLFEAQGNARSLHSDRVNGDTILSQATAMVAGQYWLTPQLWIKGGIGVAQLQVDTAYVTYDYGSGAALMGGIGFELLSTRMFSVDLQGRIIEGAYNSGNDNITAGTVGIGINWY